MLRRRDGSWLKTAEAACSGFMDLPVELLCVHHVPQPETAPTICLYKCKASQGPLLANILRSIAIPCIKAAEICSLTYFGVPGRTQMWEMRQNPKP